MERRISKRNLNTKKEILYFCKSKKINKNDKIKIHKISELLKTPIENLEEGRYFIKSTISKFKYHPVIYIKKPTGPLLRFNTEINYVPNSVKIEISKLKEKEIKEYKKMDCSKYYLKKLKQSTNYISSKQRESDY